MSAAATVRPALDCSHCGHREASAGRGWWHVFRYWGGVMLRPYTPDLDDWPGTRRACGDRCALALASALVALVHREESHPS